MENIHKRNILFIGNSFTFFNDLPLMLEKLTAAAGEEIHTEAVLRGGAYLHDFVNPEDEIGQKLREVYPTREWDYIVLQDQSFNPAGNPEDCLRSAAALCSMMKGNARFLFYSTWAYEDGTEKLSGTGMTYDEMLAALTETYQEAAEANGGIRVPVGAAFAKLYREHPEIILYEPDNFHPSAAGSYAAACLFYKAVTGNSPENLGTPEGVNECDAMLIREITAVAK